ncbi:MAG: LptF/LptG family permease [Spirochaetales bacterium]|nr:LptF/LptG family permease [Spirochaetales bacterium]
MSSKDLTTLIDEKRVEKNKSMEEYYNSSKIYKGNLISLLNKYELTSNIEVSSELTDELTNYKDRILNKPINFFFQYYVAELNKKFALSLSCLALILVSLSLATFKIKYGRLFGFGIALLLAVCYWYMLFTSQLFVFKVNFYSGLLMWIPNAFMVLLGTLMLYFTRKRR